jgi:hypothetical protein
LTLSLLTVHDASQVWIVYLVGFLVSCSVQFFSPARGAASPLIVSDPQDWLPANELLRVIQTVGMLAGPALGVLICLSMASLGFSTVNMIWIPYLQQSYGVGANGLGIADTALGVGMLASGLLIGQLARKLNNTILSTGGLVFTGFIYITILLLPSF